MTEEERENKKQRSTSPFSIRALSTFDAVTNTATGAGATEAAALRESLKKGEVKPMVHALLMKKRLPKMTLSTQNNVKFEIGGREEETSTRLHLVAIGEGKWKGVIQSNGKAIEEIIEYGSPNSKTWYYDKNAAKYAVELLNTPAEMVGKGIEVTKLPFIELVETKEQHSVLVTRPESRGVVADVFARINEHSSTLGLVTAITGPPGIGKSWTLIYVLQQALLYEDGCVIFFAQKRNKAFLFIRRGEKIYAWQAGIDKPTSDFCNVREALALLDPREAKSGGATVPPTACPLIYAASNNLKHFTQGHEKTHPDTKRYLGTPATDSLSVILKHIPPDVAIDEALKRTKDVTNAVRYILTDAMYKARMDEIRTALGSLVDQHITAILSAKGMGMVDDQGSLNSTVPGTLFMVGPEVGVAPAHPPPPNDEEDTEIEENMEIDSHRSGASLGYEGECINYEKRVITVSTEEVMSKVLQLNRKSILSFWGVVYCDESAKMGREIKKLFAADLRDKRGVTVRTQKCKTKSKDLLVGGGPLVLRQSMDLDLLEPANERAAWEALGAIFTSSGRQAAVMPDRFPIIDAAGPGRCVHQVTVGKDHTKSAAAMLMLLIVAGLLMQDKGTGKLSQCSTMSKILFYWVVPPDRFRGWTEKVAKKYTVHVPDGWDKLSLGLKSKLQQAVEQEDDVLKRDELQRELVENARVREANWMVFRSCFNKYVEQHVLEMPLKPSFANPSLLP